MILLDTHIWVWWVHDAAHLTSNHRAWLQENEARGLGLSVISCWEVAKLVERNRLALPCSIDEWFEQALRYPGIRLLQLTPRIALASTRLPEWSHRDPADQIIIATARSRDCALLTADASILNYPYVRTLR